MAWLDEAWGLGFRASGLGFRNEALSVTRPAFDSCRAVGEGLQAQALSLGRPTTPSNTIPLGSRLISLTWP